MKTDLEEAQLAEKQMRHKLDQQSEALSSKTEELRVLTERAHETMSSEILELQVQKMDMESAMVEYFPIFIFNGSIFIECFLEISNVCVPLVLKCDLVLQASLEQELQEAQYKEEQLHLANTTLQRQLERFTEEKEEREKEAVSCYNALEACQLTFSSKLVYKTCIYTTFQKFGIKKKRSILRLTKAAFI